jgi:DNA-binding LacI/PurR family transcriptional regulator
VGADYAAATAGLVDRAAALGHRRIAYVGAGAGAESSSDRMTGLTGAAARHGLSAGHEPVAGRTPVEVFTALRAAGVTAAFFEELADAVAVSEVARDRGLAIGADLSLLALGDPTRQTSTDLVVTSFHIPREEMGWQAIEVLDDILHGRATAHQRLLPCRLVEGGTLGSPNPAAGRT